MLGRREILTERLASRLAHDPNPFAVVEVDIAEVRLALHAPLDGLSSWLQGFYRSYLSENEGQAQGLLRLRRHPSEPEGLWEDPDAEFDVRGDRVIHRDFCAKKLTDQSGRVLAEAWLGPVGDDAVMNLLRWFMPPLLAERGLLLLHGAAVIRDGLGYVFFGPSGAGKSTTVASIAAADPRALVIGDDVVIVGWPPGADAPRVYAAPLGCGYSREAPPAVSAPIAGLYSLEQAGEDAAERLEPARGAALLLASAMTVGFEEQADSLFSIAERVARSGAGISRLRLERGPAFWRNVILKGNPAP